MVCKVAGAAAERAQSCVAAKFHQVGAEEAVRAFGDIVEGFLCAVGERHFAGMDFQNFAAAADVGRTDEDFAVEAARPAERRVDGVDAIGGADHDHGIDALEAVHEREQLRHRAGVGMRAGLAALGRHRVKLVDEDDRGRMVAGFVEHAAQIGFGLARIGADHVGTVDVIETRIDLVGDRAGQMRLAGAGRAVKDDAARRIDTEMAIDVWIFERELDEFANELDLLAQAADVLEGNVEGALRQVRVVIVEHDLGRFIDDARAIRHLVDFVGSAGVRIGERDVEHRPDARRRAALDHGTLEMRHEIVRHRDIDRGQ